MERLRQMRFWLYFWGCQILISGAIAAQDQCSLAVRVLLPDGRRPEAPIAVQEQSGLVQEKEQDDTDVQFCDLGILPVTVKVGSDGLCNQITIRDVPVSLERTYVLTVTYDPLACTERVPPPVPICEVLFRIADSKGVWQSNASLRVATPKQIERSTDRFGRALFVIKAGEKLQGAVEAPNFSPSAFEVGCSRSEPKIEKVIQLSKHP